MKVKLLKDWGPHKKGETVEVDDARAAQLIADEYVAAPAERRSGKKA